MGHSRTLSSPSPMRKTETHTIGDVRVHFRAEAMEHRVNPRDVDLLLADELEKPITFLLSHGEEAIEPHAVERLAELLQRRFQGEPLQYIRGRCEFYGRDFLVDPRVFIPRPETEFLVEAALDWISRKGTVVDIGTGSGCIAITLERERTDLTVVGVDLSLGALALARSNAGRLGSHARFLASNLFSGFHGPLDAVVSNPPYVPADEYDHLQREVRLHEPRMALTPGGDGLEVITQLLKDSPSRFLILEIGYKQVDSVHRAASEHGWDVAETRDDLAGIPRVVVLSRP